MSKNVLIIDDSTYMRSQIREALMNQGLEIAGEARNGESGIDRALELQPDLITLDNVLPDMSGIDVLRALKGKLPSSSIVMISAVGQPSAIKESLAEGAADYIVKPFTEEELQRVLQKIFG